MEKISRRKFLKSSMAIGAGALLMVYSDGSYRVAMAQESPAFRMRVLHTNDHHARIEPVLNGTALLHGGVSRRKPLIDNVRATEPLPVLLVDAGDIFQGTLFFNEYNGMADLEFYNAMGYEAMAIGNHEFDKGPAALAEFIKRASFPVLSANVSVTPGSALDGLYKPNTIIEKGGKKIGIFSLTPEDVAELSNSGPDVSFSSAIEAAKAQVAALKAAGAFTIIGLTHVGITVDREIARQVSGISLIIGGHSHTPMGPMNNVGTPPYPELIAAPDGKPVVVATDWEWGRWLGDMTLSFNSEGTVTDIIGNPTEVLPSLAADPGFENRIAVLAAPLNALRSTVIGSAAVELDGTRTNVRAKETNLGNLVADAMLEKTRSRGGQLVITNGGGIRAAIPAGPVTVGQVLEVLPFGNTLATIDVTGAQVKEAVDNGVSQVESGAGRFPQIAGFSFTYDPALPPNSRVTSVSYNGAPMDPAATFRVVTNNFMLTGGDGYTAFTRGSNPLDTGLILADVVQDYIAANSPVSPAVDGRIAVGAGSGATAPAPSTPAPTVPATLPNTSAGLLEPLGMLASLGASALAGGLALRRRAARVELPEAVEAEAVEAE
ncbi:5'-nucleotidase C-terminal domain-containing protein [Oscillochloris sp. ZM17-4]|uniref:bifunctional metallophosphatase/5'-nucleotidase n=1 Tax=Oscillochloris sp. ZM17-4 TaxID=2866714 RepID=UPI001C72EA95|nr:5'-nucleotidase C-terminal domain-containing protein [Oscillochloris sp. ZM17-4]MBX0326407.1 5'-nucleotidase C-terminal domain-containing protein [Oscillochloris sp. ZM17-4]